MCVIYSYAPLVSIDKSISQWHHVNFLFCLEMQDHNGMYGDVRCKVNSGGSVIFSYSKFTTI